MDQLLLEKILSFRVGPLFGGLRPSGKQIGSNISCSLFIKWHKTMAMYPKPIPGICYVGQNHIWDLVVKICKIRWFPSKTIISKIK